MDFFYNLRRVTRILFYVLLMVFAINVLAAQNSTFHRSFWQPTYRKVPLNYCLTDGVTCGLNVASLYCQSMGYDGADQSIIAYNIGYTRFFLTEAKCKNWRCNGFKTIRCFGNKHPDFVRAAHFRKAHFAYPRYLGNRVDWCYLGDGKDCGRKAAASFCRRIGYRKTIGYARDCHVGATEAIGNQKRCFGLNCQGFKFIDCFR